MTGVKGVRGEASLGERRAGGVFVGRERELSELLAGVDDALEGRGRLFLVAGEPGIGKSRLTDELAAQARERGVRVLWGRCWEAGGAPTYWPWVQALRAHVREQPPEALRGQLGAGTAELAQPAGVVAAVYEETEGNPLLVGEVVRLLADEGRLETVASEPSWHLRIPQSARAVIERRLERLSDECKDVLTLASVVGREFGLEALRRLSDLGSDELLVVLDEAIEARVVSEMPGALGRLRFSHALIRDVLYDALSTARRIRLHRRLGEVLEELYASEPEPHLAELAHHFFQAAPGGDIDRAIDYARRAGDRAAALYGYEDAVRLYRMSLDALDFREPADDLARCNLLLGLGEAQARAGEDAAAKTTFLAAAEIGRRARLPEQLARAALGYGHRYLWIRASGDPHVVPLLEDALAALPESGSPTRVRLMGRLACARRSDPDREPGAALSEQAVAMARRLGDAATLAYALDAHYGAHWWYDNPWQRLDLAAELAEVARESQDGERIVQAHLAQLAALLELGRIPEAEGALAVLAQVANKIRQPAQQWMAVAIRAMLALLRGEFAQAEELIREALQLGGPALADADAAFRAQTAWLRKEQGRFYEL